MKKTIAVILVLVLMFSLSACSGSSTKMIKEALASENGEQVNEIYNMARGNTSALKKYDKEIASFISDTIENINSQNFDADAEVSASDPLKDYLASEYGTLLPMEGGTDGIASSVSSENRQKWLELTNLIQSKAAYCNALYCYKTEKDYEFAIKYFSEIAENDSLYENAQTLSGECSNLYIKATMEKVEEYIKNNDINAGIELMNKATEYLNSNNIGSEEIKTKTDELLASYAKTYADKAEKAFAEHDVNVAMSNMEIALSLQPDNTEYKSKYDNYELYIPTKLYTEDSCLGIDQGENEMYLEFDENSTSNNNLEMPHSLIWRPWYGVNESGYCSITWNLGGNFDTICGKMYVDQKHKNSNGTSYFKAYGDGKLIYTSQTIGKNIIPQNISVNVSGIQNLKIEFIVTGFGEFGISNFIAQKNFPS